jgi:hypothetical protein
VDLHFRRLEEKGRGCYPFWVFDAGLQIRSRDSKRRIRSLLSLAPRGLSRLFEERGRLQLYCAAFGGDLEAGLSWSLHLTREQPELEETAPAAVQPVAFGRDDARRLADFVYLSSEIEAPDLVRSIDYELDLRDPQLLAVTL